MSRHFNMMGLCLALTLLPAVTAAQAPGDSTSRMVRPDSAPSADSSFTDYLMRRERFNYPATTRKDPFNSPLGKVRPGEKSGPTLAEIELTGVLYSPNGLSVAIMALPTGKSFLLHEGDYLGIAEVSLIEKKRVYFRISEYGIVRTMVKDLKPLVEGEDGTSPGRAGDGGRQQESRPADRGKDADAPR